MNSGLEVELLALVEKLKPDQLPKAAAILLKAWCDHRDGSVDSAHEFFVEVVEADECCQRNAAAPFSETVCAVLQWAGRVDKSNGTLPATVRHHQCNCIVQKRAPPVRGRVSANLRRGMHKLADIPLSGG